MVIAWHADNTYAFITGSDRTIIDAPPSFMWMLGWDARDVFDHFHNLRYRGWTVTYLRL